jgi:hypothetical protein
MPSNPAPMTLGNMRANGMRAHRVVSLVPSRRAANYLY